MGTFIRHNCAPSNMPIWDERLKISGKEWWGEGGLETDLIRFFDTTVFPRLTIVRYDILP